MSRVFPVGLLLSGDKPVREAPPLRGEKS